MPEFRVYLQFGNRLTVSYRFVADHAEQAIDKAIDLFAEYFAERSELPMTLTIVGAVRMDTPLLQDAAAWPNAIRAVACPVCEAQRGSNCIAFCDFRTESLYGGSHVERIDEYASSVPDELLV